MNLDQAPAPASETTPAVVGLGASAGGLRALEQFLAHVPKTHGSAFLIATHLGLNQPAMLAQLLQRCTTMPVCEASDGLLVKAEHVYVIPPGKYLTLVASRLRVGPMQAGAPRTPINMLFESIARDQGARAVGVVLSGMGTDGTDGLKAIKAAGGYTLAQQPSTAQFDAMPDSAIKAGSVDDVADPTELPGLIVHRARTGERGRPAQASPVPASGAAAAEATETPAHQDSKEASDRGEELRAILQFLSAQGKHDFTLYKRSTLRRRIERRMALHQLSEMPAYLAYLHSSPQELELLGKELLIGVTSFFRDSDVWEQLRTTHLPRLLASRPNGHVFRAWVAGCSTGEEAFTLAMTFLESLDELPDRKNSRLQIFATDLNRDAIEQARRSLYPASITAHVSPQRLQRFFKLEQGAYRISAHVRETVVFAPHDVASDPPFTRLDILCCRNLLIYFTAPLQHRLLPLFHFSLRAGGLLLLGSSESIGRHTGLFEALDSPCRIYQRSDTPGSGGVAKPMAVDFPRPKAYSDTTKTKELTLSEPTSSAATQATLQASVEQMLLREFSPPAVLVNEQGDILFISGRTGKYIEPAAGKANWNVHVMAREGLRAQLAAALEKASEQGAPIELHALPLSTDAEDDERVDVTVIPLQADGASTLMIVFRDLPQVPGGAAPAKRQRGRPNATRLALETQLQQAQKDLQQLRGEMRSMQEELQASNEELQSTNEELQSTNEELTSSKEELQSMNEELQVVNAELQSKIDALELAQSDMKNLLNSTEIATLFLDKSLNVRRFTETARKIFSLRDGDVGRPLSDLSNTLDYADLSADAMTTLRTLQSCERQIPTKDNLWLTARFMPYRDLDDVIAGVVITFVDITAAKQLEARLLASTQPASGDNRPS